MVGNPVLVDSSYYIALLRKGRNPLRELAVLAAQRDLAVCGLIRCEVARGIRKEEDLAEFQKVWDHMLMIPTDAELWKEVERTLWRLDRLGIMLPVSDVIIACCARRVSAVILSFDEHFLQIPGIKVTSEIV